MHHGKPVYDRTAREEDCIRKVSKRGLAAHLRAPNLVLAVELTEAGRGIAELLYRGRTRS